MQNVDKVVGKCNSEGRCRWQWEEGTKVVDWIVARILIGRPCRGSQTVKKGGSALALAYKTRADATDAPKSIKLWRVRHVCSSSHSMTPKSLPLTKIQHAARYLACKSNEIREIGKLTSPVKLGALNYGFCDADCPVRRQGTVSHSWRNNDVYIAQ